MLQQAQEIITDVSRFIHFIEMWLHKRFAKDSWKSLQSRSGNHCDQFLLKIHLCSSNLNVCFHCSYLVSRMIIALVYTWQTVLCFLSIILTDVVCEPGSLLVSLTFLVGTNISWSSSILSRNLIKHSSVFPCSIQSQSVFFSSSLILVKCAL